MPVQVLSVNYEYNGQAAGPDDQGGGWRFFLPVDGGPTPSLTLTERDFDALGRPSVVTLTVAATPQALPIA